MEYFFLFWHNVFQVQFVPALALDSNISPKISGSIQWRILFETEIWVLGMLIATWLSLLLDSFVEQETYMYIYTNAYMYTYSQIYRYIHIFLMTQQRCLLS